MANESVFNNKAAAYVSARPSYAPEAIDLCYLMIALRLM